MKEQWSVIPSERVTDTRVGSSLSPFGQLPYVFDGPYVFPESLSPEPGVFAVFCPADGAVYEIGEGENVQMLAMSSRDGHQWSQEYGPFCYIATYTGELLKKRKVIEKQLLKLAQGMMSL